VIQTILQIKACPNRVDDLLKALKSLMVSAQAEHGLVSCRLYQEVESEAVFHYVEDWQTEEDLEYQIRSNRYTQVLALMETATESPSLEFRTVSRTQGLEFLQVVRDGGRV
jgi:quinol monooxygenase YgiN